MKNVFKIILLYLLTVFDYYILKPLVEGETFKIIYSQVKYDKMDIEIKFLCAIAKCID